MSETIQDKEKAPLKVKKPKKLSKKTQETIKVDLSKKQEDAIQTQKTDDINAVVEEKKDETSGKEVVEEVLATKEEVETPVIEEIKEEVEETTKELKEAIRDEKVVGKQLPENIEKLVTFMEETGGNVEDYVRLNADYSKLTDDALLNEYYKRTKPHLNSEEINFMLEDNFTWDEEVEEERDIRKKKLALKEEIAKAKNFLEDTKSKYYDEIKLRPGVTQEQKKAMDFFNRHNKEQQIAEQHHESFKSKTNNLFTNEFKGFEFNLAEKKFRYKISNVNDVAERQSNLNTFVKKFLNNDGEVVDTVGYHKAIYAAENVDTIANHFYEQGKADAVKDVMAKSKNINTESRPQANGDMFINGLKVTAVNGVDASKLKFKSKKQ
tara:strand:- start:211 stop:1350 length:1140 start_codon:yes stop_codon:yes gene_type:complete